MQFKFTLAFIEAILTAFTLASFHWFNLPKIELKNYRLLLSSSWQNQSYSALNPIAF